MTEEANRRGVIAFLVLVFGIAWIAWGIPLLMRAGLESPLFKVAIIVAAFAPAVACFIVRKWVTREGFADGGLRLDLGRWPFYVLALLVPLAVAVGTILVAPAVGAGSADSARALASLLPPASQASNNVTAWVAVIMVLLGASVLFTPILWGEEFGWRGYLQLRLFPGRPLLAAGATGLIWGIWHYPLLLGGTELPLHPVLVLILFPLGTILYSIFFGWLRTQSGSIWAPSLAHSAVDNMRSPLVAALFAAQADKLGLALIGLALFGLVAVAVAVVERKSAIRFAPAVSPG